MKHLKRQIHEDRMYMSGGLGLGEDRVGGAAYGLRSALWWNGSVLEPEEVVAWNLQLRHHCNRNI